MEPFMRYFTNKTKVNIHFPGGIGLIWQKVGCSELALFQEWGWHHSHAYRDHFPEQSDQQEKLWESAEHPRFVGTPAASRGILDEFGDIGAAWSQHGEELL